MPLNTNIRITRSFLKQNRFICAINYDYLGEKKNKNWFDDHAAIYKKIKSQLQLTENFEF